MNESPAHIRTFKSRPGCPSNGAVCCVWLSDPQWWTEPMIFNSFIAPVFVVTVCRGRALWVTLSLFVLWDWIESIPFLFLSSNPCFQLSVYTWVSCKRLFLEHNGSVVTEHHVAEQWSNFLVHVYNISICSSLKKVFNYEVLWVISYNV